MNKIEIFQIILIVVLLLAAILRGIEWRNVALKWVGYNPARAKICIRAGMHVIVAIGQRVWMGAEGQLYVYKTPFDKIKLCLTIPNNYPDVENVGYRLIGVRDGTIVSNPLGLFDDDEINKVRESVSDISAILEGDQVVKVIKSIKSNKMQNILTWVIIAALVFGAVWYFFLRPKGEVPLNTANQTNVPAQTVNQTIPVIPGTIVPYNPSGKVVP